VPFATGTNPIAADAEFFVRQHYLDFFNRAPDAAGLEFWTKQITNCGTNAACIDDRRQNVSAAFYLSIEFQGTGYFIHRLHRASHGAALPRYEVFMPDLQQIGEGVVVNSPDWEQRLAENTDAFVESWVARPAFKAAFPDAMTHADYVDKLFAQAEVVPTPVERQTLVDGLSSGAETRASVLREVAEHPALVRQERNRAFVMMQYFGYMRRDPDEGQDTDLTGYDFWLRKLNEHGGDFRAAQMVRSFLVSGEYKRRFGPE
jgi:hypothetical protein